VGPIGIAGYRSGPVHHLRNDRKSSVGRSGDRREQSRPLAGDRGRFGFWTVEAVRTVGLKGPLRRPRPPSTPPQLWSARGSPRPGPTQPARAVMSAFCPREVSKQLPTVRSNRKRRTAQEFTKAQVKSAVQEQPQLPASYGKWPDLGPPIFRRTDRLTTIYEPGSALPALGRREGQVECRSSVNGHDHRQVACQLAPSSAANWTMLRATPARSLGLASVSARRTCIPNRSISGALRPSRSSSTNPCAKEA